MTFVKWPRLLVWHIEPALDSRTVCGLSTLEQGLQRFKQTLVDQRVCGPCARGELVHRYRKPRR